jgi:hypothetical protein
MSLVVAVDAVGLIGPGFSDWRTGSAALAYGATYVAARTVIPLPAVLPPAERRRAGRVLRLAIAAASEAAGTRASELATVFTSSGGDGENCHLLCLALATETREISPTRFMNSVHNAAAGYWHIAAGSMLPATALCAHDGSFSAGLLEAAAQIRETGEPVLLVAYDSDYPEPLRALRPVPDAFATALVLAPTPSATSLAQLELHLSDEPASTLAEPAFELLRNTIPAARCLPLLQILARERSGNCALDYLDDLRLCVQVTRC